VTAGQLAEELATLAAGLVLAGGHGLVAGIEDLAHPSARIRVDRIAAHRAWPRLAPFLHKNSHQLQHATLVEGSVPSSGSLLPHPGLTV